MYICCKTNIFTVSMFVSVSDMKFVVVYDIEVVGMRHHSASKKLVVGGTYRLQHEPDNKWDPNAVKVTDRGQTYA